MVENNNNRNVSVFIRTFTCDKVYSTKLCKWDIIMFFLQNLLSCTWKKKINVLNTCKWETRPVFRKIKDLIFLLAFTLCISINVTFVSCVTDRYSDNTFAKHPMNGLVQIQRKMSSFNKFSRLEVQIPKLIFSCVISLRLWNASSGNNLIQEKPRNQLSPRINNFLVYSVEAERLPVLNLYENKTIFIASKIII